VRRTSAWLPGQADCDDVTVNIFRGDRVGIVGPKRLRQEHAAETLVGELAPLAGVWNAAPPCDWATSIRN